jgi:hypothetical protein
MNGKIMEEQSNNTMNALPPKQQEIPTITK